MLSGTSEIKTKKVLLAEYNANDRSRVREIFCESGCDVCTVSDGQSAYEKIVGDRFDLVVSGVTLPQMSGVDLLKRVKELYKSLPVILVSGDAGVSEAVEAMKLGASDFILKPLTGDMIRVIAAQLSDGLAIQATREPPARFRIITKNREMIRLLEEAREIADSQASIFIQGESGTGKELFARYIHRHSNRRNQPFIAINCSALPETLLESELFGHEKGSFTGAITRKKGKFEIANHGTLLLDEISEMDFQLQSKLLRVLQEREIDRIGGMGPIPVDVRVIATTNRDIEKQLDQEKFREDLYYRLNVIPIHLPPLKERKDDIPLLADYFIEKYNRLDKRSVKGLTESAVQLLMRMPWKGNVRELENSIERAVLMCREDLLGDEGFSTNGRQRPAEDTGFSFGSRVSLREMEKKVIFQALDQTKGNRTHAADILGISVRTLRNKLNEYREKMQKA